MTRDRKLAEDLAALAEERRSRLGEPPTAEQLIAYRDGELPEEEAERIRDRLAVDPEWATVYLDLKRARDPEGSPAGVPVSDADVDDAWRRLSAATRKGSTATVEEEDAGAEVVPLRRRGPRRRLVLLGVAATAALAVGLIWLLWQLMRASGPALPEGEYRVVRITGEVLRSTEVRLPVSAAGAAFHILDPELTQGEYECELVDAREVVIRDETIAVEDGQGSAVFRVPARYLVDGATYRLIVRSSKAEPGEVALINTSVTIQFVEPQHEEGDNGLSFSGSPAPIPDSCADLDEDILRAIETRKRGELRAAENLHRVTRDAAHARGCYLQEAKAWNGLGILAVEESRFYDSTELFDRTAAALDRVVFAGADTEDIRELRRTLELNRGTVHFRLGGLDEARDAFQRVRALDGRLGAEPGDGANLLLQFARVSRLQGEPEEAGKAVREAFDVLGGKGAKLQASLWQEQARLDLDAGRFDDAKAALERAVEALGEQRSGLWKANLLADLAELEARRGRWAESLKWVRKTLDLASAAEEPNVNLETHVRYFQSMALHGLGDPQGALDAADRGLALMESLREAWREQGINYFALRQKHYRHRLDLADDPAEAWQIFETYRARGLLATAAERTRRPSGESGPTDLEELETLLRAERLELLKAVQQLDLVEPEAPEDVRVHREAAFRAHRQRVEELQAQARHAAGAKLPAATVGPEAAVRMLDDETLALVFAAGGESYHLLILDPRRSLERRILDVAHSRLAGRVARVATGLGPDGGPEARSRLDQDLRDLGRVLLAPVADRLDDFGRLVIVAEGPLERLPFAALRHPRTGRWLIESHELAYLPSFSVIAAANERLAACAPPAPSLFALGDPIFGPRDERWPPDASNPRTDDEALAFPRLPASAGEVRSIADLASQSVVAVGEEATRQHFIDEVAGHRVVHVASHARSHRQVLELSKLALSCLAPGGQVLETCDLYFRDVAELDLCGQIVVLSACDTAGGRPVAGEGILGLPRAFLGAGAATVVASSWRVSDEPTAELMSAFHRHLWAGAGSAAALRQAQLELIVSEHSPSDWAAFVLVGDWRTRASTFP